MDIFTRMGRSFDQLPPDTLLNAKKEITLGALFILTSATVVSVVPARLGLKATALARPEAALAW